MPVSVEYPGFHKGSARRIPAAKAFKNSVIEDLYAALFEVTETYWGVNDARNGDGGQPPACIQKARKALRAAAGSARA